MESTNVVINNVKDGSDSVSKEEENGMAPVVSNNVLNMYSNINIVDQDENDNTQSG